MVDSVPKLMAHQRSAWPPGIGAKRLALIQPRNRPNEVLELL